MNPIKTAVLDLRNLILKCHSVWKGHRTKIWNHCFSRKLYFQFLSTSFHCLPCFCTVKLDGMGSSQYHSHIIMSDVQKCLLFWGVLVDPCIYYQNCRKMILWLGHSGHLRHSIISDSFPNVKRHSSNNLQYVGNQGVLCFILKPLLIEEMFSAVNAVF